ncbi:MAG: hypothetical protein ACLPY1_20605 [Terracidiphilus sp.]
MSKIFRCVGGAGKSRALTAALVVLLSASRVVSQSQVNDKRLMTDADYKTFLLQVDSEIPKWETALRNIDPGKDERISYAVGKTLAEERDLGLMEVGNIRVRLAKEQMKRTVSGELGLFLFLQSLHDGFGEEVGLEVASGVTLSSLDKFAPELGSLQRRIGNDVLARVALLEKGTCR